MPLLKGTNLLHVCEDKFTNLQSSTGGSIGGPENIRRRDEADASYFIAPGYSVNEPAPPSVQHAFHVNNGACSGIFQTAGMSLVFFTV